MSIVLRGFIFASGLFLIIMTFRSLIHRNFSEWQCLFWIFSGLIVMLIGIFPSISIFIARIFGVDYVPSIFFAIAIVLAIYGIFYCFRAITALQNRVHELAMQVSMLNQENGVLQGKNRKLRMEETCGKAAAETGEKA